MVSALLCGTTCLPQTSALGRFCGTGGQICGKGELRSLPVPHHVPSGVRMKDFEKLLKPDERWSIIGRMGSDGFHAITLREIHDAVGALKVTATLPLEVADQFELARDLYVHAWYVYDFL